MSISHVRFTPSFLAAAFMSSVCAVGAASPASGQTVLDMPPPPMPAATKPRPVAAADAETGGTDVDAGERVTWRDQVNRNDIASDQRSYLGVVALTRFARARSNTYDTYITPRSPFAWDYRNDAWLWDFGFHHGLHFPGIDVSFLHGVPIGHGFQFGIVFPHNRCW